MRAEWYNVNGEIWSDSGYILKIEPTEFCDRSDMRCERKGGVNGNFNGLSSWKDSAITKMGISAGRAGFMEEAQELSFGRVKFERPVTHPCGDVL